MKKKFILIILLMLPLSSCNEGKISLVKEEFSKYYNGKSEVVVESYDDIIYGEDFEYSLNKLVDKNKFSGGYLYKNNKLYFSTYKRLSLTNYELNIYEANVDGTDINQIFTKDGYKSAPITYAYDDYFYIEHGYDIILTNIDEQIDRYTISTGEYLIISYSPCSHLDDYKKDEYSKYDIEKSTYFEEDSINGIFTITDKETGVKKIIDNDYFENTIYIDSLNKYKYRPRRFDVSNGHILLTYKLGDNSEYNDSCLIFEYYFESNSIEYKALIFPANSAYLKINYTGYSI